MSAEVASGIAPAAVEVDPERRQTIVNVICACHIDPVPGCRQPGQRRDT